MEEFKRLEALIGETNFNKLQNKKICVIGVGGVGGMVAYSLVRSGIGQIYLIDHDTVNITNLNRQIVAYQSTIGKKKIEVLKELLLDINPHLNIEISDEFYDENSTIDLKQFDYVIDCIDSVPSKLCLIERCLLNDVKIISSMGAGNRLDPTKVVITDISKTYNDPLAKIVRINLRKKGINHLKVCFSTEDAKKILIKEDNKNSPASSCFVPNAFGLAIGSFVIKDLLEENND